MCLLVFSIGTDGCFVCVANRDEAYARPTAALSFWPDEPQIAAGRDLRAGGTWLGVSRAGRFAALTNFRGMGRTSGSGPSRGELPVAFLRSRATPAEFVHELQSRADAYAGFNLLVGAERQFVYFSNVDAVTRALGPGLYGLSNRWLDTPWPKVVRAKEQLATALARGLTRASSLSELLADRSIPGDAELPDTGVGLELERALSPSFIVTPSYGTRSTTGVIMDAAGQVDIHEKSFGRAGAPLSEVGQRFEL